MKFKTILLLLALCVAVGANAQTNEDVVDRVSRAVGVRLPDGYEAKVKEFVMKSKVLEGIGGEFTEQWIAGQMKTSWGIDRGNQLLFVWDAVYEQITKKNFYDGEDGNKKRLDEFEKVMDNVEACGKKYKEDFTAHMKQQSAEANQDRVIMSYYMLYLSTDFYTMRNAATESEIKQAKEFFEDNIKECKEFKINYQSLLPTEVQRFYGINPVQQNSLTCDKAKVQILNIVLQEIVKLYNICQKAPQAKREKRDIKRYIDAWKKHNIDYKSKLSPEVRRFFGIE